MYQTWDSVYIAKVNSWVVEDTRLPQNKKTNNRPSESELTVFHAIIGLRWESNLFVKRFSDLLAGVIGHSAPCEIA